MDMKRVIFGAALLLAAGCSSSGNTASTAGPLRVSTIVVEPREDLHAGIYVGVVEEENAAALSFPVAGTVTRLCVEEGTRVRQGDLIAELDATSARDAFEAAKAALQQARDACERLQRLYDAKTLPEIQWVEAQTRLRQAEAAYGIAEKNLGDCRLRAPFDGVVGQKRASVGETALPGVPVLTLLEIGRVKVRFSVPEQEIASITANNRVRVVVPALHDALFEAGRIEKGAEANPAPTPTTCGRCWPIGTARSFREWSAV